jgi:CheY-like chemotaxis protein
MRVLIVDDDANSRRIITFFLNGHATCFTAANCLEATQAVESSYLTRTPFDLIYLDMMMPDGSGIDFLKVMRGQEASHGIVEPVPVIMLTGDAQFSRINQAKLLGAVEYLLKPISENRLLQGLGLYSPATDELSG